MINLRVLVVFFLFSIYLQAKADINISTGDYVLINHIYYQYEIVFIDRYTNCIPGTHLEIVEGGVIGQLVANYNSKVFMSGGKTSITAHDNTVVGITGGKLGLLGVYEDSIMEISGGTLTYNLIASGNGKVNLYGSDFSVNGQSLSNSGSIRSFATPGGFNNQYLQGTLSGVLRDGSFFSSNFTIDNHENALADIFIVVPEPLTLLLLGLGGVVLRRR